MQTLTKTELIEIAQELCLMDDDDSADTFSYWEIRELILNERPTLRPYIDR